jgi:hypothetical protein
VRTMCRVLGASRIGCNDTGDYANLVFAITPFVEPAAADYPYPWCPWGTWK